MESLQSALAAIQKKLATPELVAAAQDVAAKQAVEENGRKEARKLREERVRKNRGMVAIPKSFADWLREECRRDCRD